MQQPWHHRDCITSRNTALKHISGVSLENQTFFLCLGELLGQIEDTVGARVEEFCGRWSIPRFQLSR